MEEDRAGEEALRGLVPTLKSLSRSGGQYGEERERLWENPAFSDWNSRDQAAAELCRLVGWGRDTPWPPGTRRSSPRPLPRPREEQTPAEDGGSAVVISARWPGRPQAVTLIPLPQPLRPAPTNPHPRPGSWPPLSRTPAPVFRRCSALLAHSP